MELNDLKIAVVGLGYVGLPLAVEFGKKRPVVGFDINESRIAELRGACDHTLETDADELKAELCDHTFHSETDTEVIAHLIGANLKKGMEFPEAVRQAFLRLKGRNAIVVMYKDFEGLVGVRFGSPMVLGIKDGEEYFIGSDSMAFSDETNKVIYMEDNEMVVVN